MQPSNGETFKVIFDSKWLDGPKKLKRQIRRYNTKLFLMRILGIYNTYDGLVEGDPTPVKDGYEYTIKLTLVHKYFFWIRYKTEIWKEVV